MAREARDIKVAPRADVELRQLEDIGVLGAGNYGSVALVMLAHQGRSLSAFASVIVTDNSLLRMPCSKKLMSMSATFVGRLLNTYRDETQLYMLSSSCRAGSCATCPS